MATAINVCRICLKTENLLCIFEREHDENYVPIWAKIVYCASVQVSESDLLPKLICSHCSRQLDIAYTFKTMCETTDKKLRTCTNKTVQENNNNSKLVSTFDEWNVNEEYSKNKEFTEHGQNIEDLLLQDVQMAAIDIATVIPNDYQSREHSYKHDTCEAVNECGLAINNVEKQNVDISNSDVDRDIPRDSLKVGRHIAKKNSGKFPQKFQATLTKKKQIANNRMKDILSNDANNYDNDIECDVLHHFENVLESDIPVVGFEETVVTDNNAFSFDMHTNNDNFDSSTLEQTRTKQCTNNYDEIKRDAFTSNNKINTHESMPKVKLKINHTTLQPGSKKVNVFNDRHIKNIKTKRKSKELMKKVKIRPVKKSKQSFKCDVCSKVFPFKSHLERHINVHTGIKKFSCDYCQQKFINSYNLSVHVLKHTDEFPLKCQSCNKGFANQSLLKRHEVTHTGEAKFQCRYCPVKLRQSSSLRLHERMHLHRPSYHCVVCYKVFSYSNSLAAHKKQHYDAKRYSCDSCSNTFSRKSSLIRHIEGHHKTKRVRCKFCGQLFNNKNACNLHLKTHRHECEVCGDSFQHKTTLVHHMKTHRDVLECEQCAKVFSNKVQLVKHLKKHVK